MLVLRLGTRKYHNHKLRMKVLLYSLLPAFRVTHVIGERLSLLTPQCCSRKYFGDSLDSTAREIFPAPPRTRLERRHLYRLSNPFMTQPGIEPDLPAPERPVLSLNHLAGYNKLNNSFIAGKIRKP